MTHSLTTTTTVTRRAATEPGALDGWHIVCQCCGPLASFSIESMAREHAREHVRLMTGWGK